MLWAIIAAVTSKLSAATSEESCGAHLLQWQRSLEVNESFEEEEVEAYHESQGSPTLDFLLLDNVDVGSEKLHVDTVYDVLDKMCRVPERPVSAPMRMPISGIYKIKGVGDVLAGRVEQGVVKPGEEVIFLPTHTASNPCTGKVFTVEMHHQRADFANPGDNVGLNIKGLDKNNMPRSGDVMVYKKDTTLGQTREFDAQIQVLDIPNEIKTGYSPIGFVRCGRAACRISALKWKMGKETGGKKMEEPHSLKSNEMAQCSFQPQQPLVCDTFKNCEGLSRVAFMDGNGVVMLGKVVTCERKEGDDKGGKKK